MNNDAAPEITPLDLLLGNVPGPSAEELAAIWEADPRNPKNEERARKANELADRERRGRERRSSKWL